MEISQPNEYGALKGGSLRIVARRRERSYAGVRIAFCEDGLFRFSIELRYSYGGCGGPIFDTDQGYATEGAAEIAGVEELLGKWPTVLPYQPVSVNEELHDMHCQLQARLSQPSLF